MSLSTPARQIGIIGVLAAFLVAAGVLALFTPSAPADVVKPVIVLGPTIVANGAAVVSGSVGAPYSSGQLTINGQPIAVDAAGNFAGTVNLNGQSELSFAVRNPVNGETTVAKIPLTTNTVGLGGLLTPGVLSALEQAGVSILKPLDGFRILDGLPLQVEGSVLDRSSLASLTVNGKDVLGLIGADRVFRLDVPGSTKEVTVTATDRSGVTQTNTFPVTHASSAVQTPQGPSVGADGALGLRVAKVRYIVKKVKRTKRFRMVITIRDQRGLLVRGAVVRVRSARASRLLRNPKAKNTNRVGQAAFLLGARKRAFGKRLVMITFAQTKMAKAKKNTSVRLPRLTRPAGARR